MIKKEQGFTIIELLITMVIFVLVIAAASNMFTGLLTQFKQQSKIAETNIEGMVGLEMLRFDIEQAGYGLPWSWTGALGGYSEASGALASSYNDTPNAPRAVLIGDGAGSFGSDELIIKATTVATNDAAHKWTYIANSGASNLDPVIWRDANDTAIDAENLVAGTDRVIVIRPAIGTAPRVLVAPGGVFFTLFRASCTGATPFAAGFQPNLNTFNTHLVYGIGTQDPRMPFNRADYYISNSSVPSRCAPNTGVLIKSVISHADGTRGAGLPLLDCVADFQVIIGADTNLDGTIDDGWQSVPVAETAETIRNKTKEIRVYIIAHEGQRDPNYTYVNPDTGTNSISITDPDAGTFKTFAGLDPNYRWKLYTMRLKPQNLR